MASKDMITKIILKGVTDPSLTKAFQNAKKLADNNLNTLKKAGEFAKKTAKIGAGAVIAGLGASVKASIDYESAFAGVMKTVDETSTTTYDDLSNSIRKMSERMPASANDIAGVAEVAGQLGIKADDIMKFTETMINLGESTNIVADDAASTIAKYFNITKTGMGDVDRFGATLVALGNNAATTEADIMNMASRIGASGNMIGLSNQEILALATSLSSVGLEAEGGGTAISTILSKVDKEVATNGKTLKTWASLAGMSTSQFKTAWQTDTMGTIQKFVSGMGDAKKGGKNLNIILEDLGIKGIRTSDTMKRLTNASELMADMTDLSNKAWDDNTALTDEVSRRYGTMASKIQMLKNKLTNVGITVGNKLMPVIDNIIKKMDEIDWDGVGEKIGNVIQWISDHSTTLMTIIGALAGVIAGVKIAGIIKGIITVIKVISTLSKTFGLMKVIMAALGGPVTIVIAIIGALVGAFIVLWKKSDKFRNFWIGLWDKIKSAAKSVGEWLKNFFTVTIPTAFNSFVEKCKSVGSSIKNFFTVTIPNAFNTVVTFFTSLPGKIWTWLVNTAQKVVAWGSQLASKGRAAATKLVTTIVNKIKELPNKLMSLGKNIVEGLWKGINNAKDWLVGRIKSFASGITDGIKDALGIHSPSTVMEKMVGKFIPSGIAVGIQRNVGTAINAVKNMGGKIASTASQIKPTIQTKIATVGNKIKSFGKGGTETSPQNAIVGYNPSTIIPNGSTQRNGSFLTDTAKSVGQTIGNAVYNITFSPVINGGNASEIQHVLENEEEKFKQMIDNYFKEKGVLAY